MFIAPHIHRDTLNTFWMSVKMGYEGKPQKIVPLTLEQYIHVLQKVKQLNSEGIRVNHRDLHRLLAQIYTSHEQAGHDSTLWLVDVDTIIEQWATFHTNQPS